MVFIVMPRMRAFFPPGVNLCWVNCITSEDLVCLWDGILSGSFVEAVVKQLFAIWDRLPAATLIPLSFVPPTPHLSSTLPPPPPSHLLHRPIPSILLHLHLPFHTHLPPTSTPPTSPSSILPSSCCGHLSNSLCIANHI